MHAEFHSSFKLMFCSMIRSKACPNSFWPLSIRKGSPTCLIYFLWSYSYKNKVHSSKQDNQRYQEDHQTIVRMVFWTSQSQEKCVNYHNGCVKYVLSGKRTFLKHFLFEFSPLNVVTRMIYVFTVLFNVVSVSLYICTLFYFSILTKQKS